MSRAEDVGYFIYQTDHPPHPGLSYRQPNNVQRGDILQMPRRGLLVSINPNIVIKHNNNA